jgi:hypothetical protein
MSEPGTEHTNTGHTSTEQPVERYLDELFDRLTGTGAAGRRALAEAEDHLRTAVDDGVASGLSWPQAEIDAVRRFGPVALVARQLRAAHRRRVALSALSGGWLLAGLTVAGLGVTYLSAALSVVILERIRPDRPPLCRTVSPNGVVGPCPGNDSLVGSAALAGVIVLLIGAAILIGRTVATRRTGLPAAASRFPALATGLFVTAGAVFVMFPPTEDFLGARQGPGLRIAVIAATVAVLMALGMATWGLLRLRRAGARAGGLAAVH